MEIGNLKISVPKLVKANNKTQTRYFNDVVKDSVTITRVDLNTATNEILSLKQKNGKPYFRKSEIEDFRDLYNKGNIDVDVVKEFKDENISMKNMSKIYTMKTHITDKNDKEKFYNGVKKAMHSVPKDEMVLSFASNPYNPSKEYLLHTFPKDERNAIKKYEPLLDIGRTNKELKFDLDGNQIGKTECIALEKTEGTDAFTYNMCSTDFKSNRISYSRYANGANGNILRSLKVLQRDKDNKVVKLEEMTPSDIKGVMNVKYTYDDGKIEEPTVAKFDERTGITTIKKDLKSADGTRTQFLYEDDPQGNRIVDYKITDKNGKPIFSESLSFEVVSDNKFISSKNNYKYEISVNDKNIKIKDYHHDKEASINFKEIGAGDKNELVSLLKKISGDMLFDIAESVDCININDKEKVMKSCYIPYYREIITADNLFTFLHELGHAKDNELLDVKEVGRKHKKQEEIFTSDPAIRKIYIEEKEKFNETHTDEEIRIIDYFTRELDHYSGKWGGLSEIVAETNALTNIYPYGEIVGKLGPRTQFLQENFPKTIAAIKNAMEWKNDIAAIEYYGT